MRRGIEPNLQESRRNRIHAVVPVIEYPVRWVHARNGSTDILTLRSFPDSVLSSGGMALDGTTEKKE